MEKDYARSRCAELGAAAQLARLRTATTERPTTEVDTLYYPSGASLDSKPSSRLAHDTMRGLKVLWRAHLVIIMTRCEQKWAKTHTPGCYFDHVCTPTSLRKVIMRQNRQNLRETSSERLKCAKNSELWRKMPRREAHYRRKR